MILFVFSMIDRKKCLNPRLFIVFVYSVQIGYSVFFFLNLLYIINITSMILLFLSLIIATHVSGEGCPVDKKEPGMCLSLRR